MPRNGSGQYDLPYDWNDDKANGIKVLASRMQNQDQDIATALTGSLASDGQTPLTGNLDFNGNKCVDLADGSDAADSVNVSQVQTGEFQFYGVSTTTPAGTDGEDYDLGPTPSITVYPTYTRFSFVCHYTCIINPNMRFGTLATRTLKKSDGAGGYTSLVAGDMVADKEYVGVLNDDVSLTDIIIENPENTLAVNNDLIANLAISTSVSSNALTIALKTKAGTDPTSSDPVDISFRSSTATSGSYNTREITSAVSLVVSSGSTLGTLGGSEARLYVYALDNSGTVELAISSKLYPDNSIQSTSAEGGAGAADSSTTIYSTTARSNVPIRLVGIITITEATAGTWSLDATTVDSAPINNVASSTGVRYVGRLTASSTTTLGQPLSTGKKYIFRFNNILPSVNSAFLTAQYSTDGGSTLLSASYKNISEWHTNADPLAGHTNKTSGLTLSGMDASGDTGVGNNASRGGLNGWFILDDPSQSSSYKQSQWKTTHYNSTSFNYFTNNTGGGAYEGATTAINYIGFTFKQVNSNTTSGVITSGTIDVWEINA